VSVFLGLAASSQQADDFIFVAQRDHVGNFAQVVVGAFDGLGMTAAAVPVKGQHVLGADGFCSHVFEVVKGDLPADNLFLVDVDDFAVFQDFLAHPVGTDADVVTGTVHPFGVDTVVVAHDFEDSFLGAHQGEADGAEAALAEEFFGHGVEHGVQVEPGQGLHADLVDDVVEQAGGVEWGPAVEEGVGGNVEGVGQAA